MDIASLPVTALKGVGPKLADKLKRLGLQTVQDVLFHLPLRYQDRTRLLPIGSLRPGMEAAVEGEIELADVVFRGRRSLICRVSDGTGHLHLRFFYFNAIQQQNLARGRRLRLFGEVRFGPVGLEMIHPEYEFTDGAQPTKAEENLTPVYPATTGVHQLSLRKLARQALEQYLEKIEERLPPAVLQELQLPTLTQALALVHQPPPHTPVELLAEGKHPAVLRLSFEELLAHHLSLKRLRARMQTEQAPPIVGTGELMKQLLTRLPFQLTRAQQRVLDEILHDLRQGHPMQRLVQGDVGSGKTIVAACASLGAIESGLQVAVMAPTELLADQHLRNFSGWLEPLGVSVVGLSGKLNGRARQGALEKIGSGRAAIAIGTQALFQEGVEFADLGLIVVDEQHRFGVHQRLALREKGRRGERRPHQLIMTATPIPRTLAQSLYADLDVSVIDELPPGRKPVETVAIPSARRADVVSRIRDACSAGRQAYWVCPLIEESETLELETATDTAEALREALPELRIALIHGRMKPPEKEKIMASFKRGDVHLLVATTVIEVGVDVPNASLMVIENAERLGLSQLHQLRGRIGRGAVESHCVLLYQPPLSEMARARLAAVRETSDGFEIARRDLEMRGPGEMLGTRQAGMPQFHIADLLRDRALLPRVQSVAEQVLQEYPERVDPIVRRWLGRAEEYGSV
ncbi:MAG: ATP-dependent DNA helicase RecG [Candidatus Muproteobacteria bacterium RIFCSPHIGHO2_12_FULL_60_33]|uniref:ATP-dependent DNA helicase RecG n=1 Tax=Candidatus Muproteobacteria bacterium RIFCSPLOWO2_01_FULL_60_18 TaxID=1817768 RepID=A0A1F6TWL9_9PROT|nr:MAG: ATP-dependent DNA helicase RecG [Candidatus Muproteobacteria bacterium RIFCSPHIGHO2_01_60_12]OGI49544.1 MAG: ATP-dependent DNA helicase RecG [Candidatus Muproteobacteria bacterium RIFCSPLOWO2_01_FULL_60_18]OGI55711.1 MAG: ATP-dependent DNA helicase RecG [Candidatus Muproteobacteria bacterium RIFCSPHIGHO2_02_FULL_60_13]OGI55734.1 MAG: ATP-dependent DNA helicase RecG [Candidatus Muproteobacteria bacterium RIFCSPHIGHO2_12_FULL_60_33]